MNKLDHYYLQLKSLLPHGRAWEISKDHLLNKVIRSIAAYISKFEKEKERALSELFVENPDRFLEQWEKFLELESNYSKELRRLKLRQFITKRPFSLSRNYFVSLCAEFGFVVEEIKEFRPFRAGESCAGEKLTNGYDWARYWIIVVDLKKSRPTVSQKYLEQQINKFRPGHTNLSIEYRG